MILFNALTDDYADSILATLAILVLDKHLRDDPLNKKLKALVDVIGKYKTKDILDIKEKLHVMAIVESHMKYSDASIIESFIHYFRESKQISKLIIDEMKWFEKEYF